MDFNNRIDLTGEECRFVAAYLDAIVFTETGDTDQPPADAELDADFLRESTLDCLSFYSRISCYLNSDDDQITQAGHDFWLTRNRHGAGFWDGDWSDFQGTHFTAISSGYGEVDAMFEDHM